MHMVDPGATHHLVNLTRMAHLQRQELFTEIYKKILMPAFPANELTPLGALDSMWAGTPPRLAVHAALDCQGQPVGCAVAQWFPQSTVLLFAYLAVHADCRGNGIGTSLLKQAIHEWMKAYGPILVVAEVEDPGVYPRTPDQDPMARLRLYARLGARLLVRKYVQPEINPGAGRARDLLLLADPKCSAGIVTNGAVGVPATVVLTFLHEYYRDSEGEGYKDKEFDAMIQPLADSATIPLLQVPLPE